MPGLSFDEKAGRDIRFRDAESLFRAVPPVETGPVEPETATPVASELASPSPDAAPRRILPDLVAEAALSEATLAAAPEPRRRGRPPKTRSEESPRPDRPREPPEPEFDEVAWSATTDEIALPAVLYLAASARRRARRATDNLPRAERWKRRLPKVCW